MPDISSNDHALRETLQTAKVIAVVGHSDKPHRTSYQIARYLQNAGYKVYPVNPSVNEIDGEKSYASLADIPDPIDIVNVFRRAEHLPDIVKEAIQVGAKTVWGQLGVTHPLALATIDDTDINLVMDRCIKIEHYRLEVN